MHAAWLDLFILRMMGYCEDQAAKRVWFVLDELASLNKLPQLHAAVTENRKYGNPVLIDLQGRSQIDKRYGQALKPCSPGCNEDPPQDFGTARGEVDLRGHRRDRGRTVERIPHHRASRVDEEFRDGNRHQPLIMPSEIAGLPPITGFIKIENYVLPAKFSWQRN